MEKLAQWIFVGCLGPCPIVLAARRFRLRRQPVRHGDGAKMTLYLLFIDAQGKEVVPRIRRYRESDYSSHYLEAPVANARAAIYGVWPKWLNHDALLA